MYIWQFNSSKKGRNCSNKHHRSHDCAKGYCHLQMTSIGPHICLTRDHVIESGVCIWFSPQVPYSRVFHDKMNHEAHSSMKAPKSDNDVVKLTVQRFIVHNSKGFPLLWLIKCYDWCDLMPCRRIVYELESIQLDMDWWHACIITLERFLSFRLKMDEDLSDVTRCCEVFLWHKALYSGRIQFLISQM